MTAVLIAFAGGVACGVAWTLAIFAVSRKEKP